MSKVLPSRIYTDFSFNLRDAGIGIWWKFYRMTTFDELTIRFDLLGFLFAIVVEWERKIR